MTRLDAVELLRTIREAMATREGRALAREIAAELQRAAEEATEQNPAAAEAQRLLTRARRRGGR